LLFFGLAVWLANSAHADINDRAYLMALDRQGIETSVDPTDYINIGHDVCDMLDGGAQPLTAVYTIVRSAEKNDLPVLSSAYNAGFVVGAAVAAYCPQYRSLIPKGGVFA
jgi:hypothetical protein